MGCCCDKDKHGDHNKMPKKMTIINDRWRTGRQLGKGGYGKVYKVYDVTDNNKPYAMKTEHLRTAIGDTGRLPQEALLLEQLTAKGKTRHVPKLLDKGRIEVEPGKPTQFIVMTLLGPSLSDMRKFCKNKEMLPSTVAIIGVQTIEAMEDLHLTGYIHRDIK